MVRIDMEKVKELRDQAEERTKTEISVMKDKKGDDFTEDDEKFIRNRNLIQVTKFVNMLSNLGPEKLFKSGYAETTGGWREGYTKPTIEKRRERNRKKNKEARVARRAQKRMK